MTRLFLALEHGYTRAETLDLVLRELRREHDYLRPYPPHLSAHLLAYGTRSRARRTARRFLAGQIAAHERALEHHQ